METHKPRRGFISDDESASEEQYIPRRFAAPVEDEEPPTPVEAPAPSPVVEEPDVTEPRPAGPRRGMPVDDLAASGDDTMPPPVESQDPLAPRRAVPLPEDVVERREERRKAKRLVFIIALALALILAIVYFLVGGASRASRAMPAPATPASVASTAVPAQSLAPVVPVGVVEDVDDTSITVPADWELYADETTEKDRRLIRIREPESGTTMQVTTLTTVGEDLVAMCEALIGDQREGFAVDSEQVPTEVTAGGDAFAVVCGFGGAKEAADSSVQFTLIQRESDKHTLVLRSIQDRALGADSPAVETTAQLKCEAARNFSTPLPLC